MNCNKEQLLLLWSNELDDNHRQELLNHIQTCDDCREFWQELQQLDGIADAGPAPEHDLVLAALTAIDKPIRRFPVKLLRLAALIPLAFVLIVAIRSLQTPSTPGKPDNPIPASNLTGTNNFTEKRGKQSPLNSHIKQLHRRILKQRHRQVAQRHKPFNKRINYLQKRLNRVRKTLYGPAFGRKS